MEATVIRKHFQPKEFLFQNTALEVVAKKTGILLRNEDSCTKAVTAENYF